MARKNRTGGHGKDRHVAKDASYSVGYGRPPLATRFKPNQSGNPRGRPRRRPSLRTVLEKALEEKVEIREGERVLRMSNRQALARAALRRALNGDPKLLRALAFMMRAESESGQPEDEAASRVSASDEAILTDFISRHGGQLEQDNKQADESAQPPIPDQRGRKR